MPPEPQKPDAIEPPPPVLQTPKGRFLAGQHRKAHEQWTDTAASKAAIETALAEYVDGLGEQGDKWQSIMAYNRLLGARKVLRILANLHLPDTAPRREPLKNLKPPS